MATIKVRVQGEIATNLTPEVRLVCQNDKYDVEFEFDDSWSNSNFKTALFIYNGNSIAVPFDREQNGNVCKIPALYDTELLHIGIKSNDIDGLHTSTPARVGCLLSANDIANGEIPNPTPSQYDEIIALINKYIGQGGSGGTDEERVREIVEEETADLVAESDRDEFVKGGLTESTETWTDDDKAKACETIGATPIPKAGGDNGAFCVLMPNGTIREVKLAYANYPSVNGVLVYNPNRTIMVNNAVANTDAPNWGQVKSYVDGLIAKLKEDNDLV